MRRGISPPPAPLGTEGTPGGYPRLKTLCADARGHRPVPHTKGFEVRDDETEGRRGRG